MIKINGVSKSYGKLEVLKDISLNIEKGEVYGLIGKSGAGKSTLLRCINGLEDFSKGSIEVKGVEIDKLKGTELRAFRKNIGMIFQDFAIVERKSAYENVAFPLRCWGYKKTEIDKRVRELLLLTGIEDKINVKSYNLSGGQKQRVAIARALALSPDILLCDEATSALDPKTTKDILKLLEKINEELRITLIVVTHQMSVVKNICTKVALLENGNIVEEGSVTDVFLRRSEAWKRFMGEGEESYPKGTYEIITQDKEGRFIISELAQVLGKRFEILNSSTENFRSASFGRYIIKSDIEDSAVIEDFLNQRNVQFRIYGGIY